MTAPAVVSRRRFLTGSAAVLTSAAVVGAAAATEEPKLFDPADWVERMKALGHDPRVDWFPRSRTWLFVIQEKPDCHLTLPEKVATADLWSELKGNSQRVKRYLIGKRLSGRAS